MRVMRVMRPEEDDVLLWWVPGGQNLVRLGPGYVGSAG